MGHTKKKYFKRETERETVRDRESDCERQK